MVAFFLVVFVITFDFLLKKKEKIIEDREKKAKSPIFMSPEKALRPLDHPEKRLFHFSHSWALPDDNDGYYIGYDGFIPFLFSDDVNVDSFPPIGALIHQGDKIWEVRKNNRKVTQLSPISGEVVEINPAFSIGIPLPSDQVETSWIIKLKPSGYKNEVNNLLDYDQANIMNMAFKDVIISDFQGSDYLNDGGTIDPSFITNLNDEEWEEFLNRFFPGQTSSK